ncbi:hypothetical protein NEOLEDRAFT_1069361 [Neolentinus lepideus HHB14362 ss-1]|uniref:BRCT domain-containing protein n=1 Tax=Neolentinus lepideus HHB14362 ss-1 TaxID=1314782 RepID=A0A165RBL3_9AGAM|nr:hypothetical protein NEOLEDRAFT_1069361 [Neolentinus lepideus HHB14362 ss-1]
MQARSAPGLLGRAAKGTATHVSASRKARAESVAPETGLGVLKDCTIFVDVRTDDGDDAGGLFVEMLMGLGAKILSRAGQTCTHIVFKNGLMSTVTRYRLLNDPKPHVVGIAWVVECVEQRAKADETRFGVDMDGVGIAVAAKVMRGLCSLPSSALNSVFLASSPFYVTQTHAHVNARAVASRFITEYRAGSSRRQ